MWRVHRSLTVPGTAKNLIAFCGIARPQQFIDQLRTAGIQPVATKSFPDHHRYTDRDIRDLLELKDRYSADGFIATQKDAINLGEKYVPLAPVLFPAVKMELLYPADALDTMFRVIANAGPKRERIAVALTTDH